MGIRFFVLCSKLFFRLFYFFFFIFVKNWIVLCNCFIVCNRIFLRKSLGLFQLVFMLALTSAQMKYLGETISFYALASKEYLESLNPSLKLIFLKRSCLVYWGIQVWGAILGRENSGYSNFLFWNLMAIGWLPTGSQILKCSAWLFQTRHWGELTS